MYLVSGLDQMEQMNHTYNYHFQRWRIRYIQVTNLPHHRMTIIREITRPKRMILVPGCC